MLMRMLMLMFLLLTFPARPYGHVPLPRRAGQAPRVDRDDGRAGRQRDDLVADAAAGDEIGDGGRRARVVGRRAVLRQHAGRAVAAADARQAAAAVHRALHQRGPRHRRERRAAVPRAVHPLAVLLLSACLEQAAQIDRAAQAQPTAADVGRRGVQARGDAGRRDLHARRPRQVQRDDRRQTDQAEGARAAEGRLHAQGRGNDAEAAPRRQRQIAAQRRRPAPAGRRLQPARRDRLGPAEVTFRR